MLCGVPESIWSASLPARVLCSSIQQKFPLLPLQAFLRVGIQAATYSALLNARLPA
jgi:hypothetical protein